MGHAVRQVGEMDRLIGSRLRLRRKLLRMSQKQVANACAISPQQYFKYETGSSRLSVVRLIEIAHALHTEPFAMLDDITSPAGDIEAVSHLLDNADAVELLTLFASIDDQATRRAAIRLIREFSTSVDQATKQATND